MHLAKQRLRLAETFRNLFYTPIYVAVGGGFLYREGLDVLLETAPAGRPAIDLLKSGAADILQTGISRSLMDLDDGNEDAPLHIAEINSRDGFFLVSRRPVEGWRWTDIEGARLIPVGFTPVPWTSLRAALLARGVDLSKVTLIQGLSAEDALDRFRAGDADYIHMPNPQAQQLVEDGAGQVAAALGPELGHICYSSFAVTPRYLEGNAETLQRFTRGFYRAQQWLVASEPATVAETVAGFFPGVAHTVLERSIERYAAQETWALDPLIREDAFVAMRDVLVEGGLVRGRHTYERLVRPELALEAMGRGAAHD